MLSFAVLCGFLWIGFGDLIVFIWLQYLIFIFVVIVFLLAVQQSVARVLAFRIESIDDYLLGAFNFSSAEGTSLKIFIEVISRVDIRQAKA